MSKDFLWVEKYRPRSIKECILPENLLKTFSDIVVAGEMPNMLLTGTAGLGKTTVARALCNELGLDYIIINGSEEGNIDTLRGKIKQFASSVSFTGGYKVVILDEADYLNPQSTQPALRGFIEEFHKNCRFILTCNFKNRIIEPLHSRFSNIEFRINNKDKPKLAAQLFERARFILAEQDIAYERAVIAELVNKHFPDNRKLINELQRYSVAGTIDAGVLVNISDENLKSLTGHLKGKEFGEMRKWVVNNLDNDPVKIFRKIYDSLYTTLEP